MSPVEQHEPTDKPTTMGLSVSVSAALGFIGVVVTLFGSVIIGLLLYTLNNLSDRITTVEARITTTEANLNDKLEDMDDKLEDVEEQLTGLSLRQAAMEEQLTGLSLRQAAMEEQLTGLSLRQADVDETLSVLVAILNARREVEAAKAHEIIIPD